jgi:hypothetical protein
MISNTQDKLSKSKLALLEHRFVTEIQQVTGGNIPVQVSVVCMRCPDKSGKLWGLNTVILYRHCLVRQSNLMFDNCKFKFWCYCLSFWILHHGILVFCVHMALLTVGKVAF